jgi:hypothetical protein
MPGIRRVSRRPNDPMTRSGPASHTRSQTRRLGGDSRVSGRSNDATGRQVDLDVQDRHCLVAAGVGRLERFNAAGPVIFFVLLGSGTRRRPIQLTAYGGPPTDRGARTPISSPSASREHHGPRRGTKNWRCRALRVSSRAPTRASSRSRPSECSLSRMPRHSTGRPDGVHACRWRMGAAPAMSRGTPLAECTHAHAAANEATSSLHWIPRPEHRPALSHGFTFGSAPSLGHAGETALADGLL